MDPETLQNCKIILVIGPTGAGKTSLLKLLTGENLVLGHKLDHGTALPTQIRGTINDESFLFIDSPGFGHATFKPGVVKKQIHSMLGYFTRELGGIHGILYIHDILTEREVPGMQEATEFLRELAAHDFKPHITFITTKWDIPSDAPKLTRKYGQDLQQQGRQALLNNVIAYYINSDIESLAMPFSEWTYGQQSFKIATVTGQIIKVAGGYTLAGAAAYGLIAGIASGYITVSFRITF
ncbi:hypothetical protein ACJA88_011500 [Fusarium oxysporum]